MKDLQGNYLCDFCHQRIHGIIWMEENAMRTCNTCHEISKEAEDKETKDREWEENKTLKNIQKIYE
ncbi:MAG TPA: hypothetical protein VKR58_06215 [Aquella sp.]|nr:hypothetical protein [Aquella sp.]